METATATPEIGAQIEGGTYTGAIRIGSQIFGIVVASKADGESRGIWLDSDTEQAGTDSFFDGMTNTKALAEAGSPIAAWARALRIADHDDWYVPSRDELELIYRNLKPTTEANWRHRGDNPSSVPVGYAYRPNSPAQTTVEAFRAGGAEAMEPTWYWSSTQDSADWAWSQYFDDGSQGSHVKGFEGRVRAVRRFLID